MGWRRNRQPITPHLRKPPVIARSRSTAEATRQSLQKQCDAVYGEIASPRKRSNKALLYSGGLLRLVNAQTRRCCIRGDCFAS